MIPSPLPCFGLSVRDFFYYVNGTHPGFSKNKESFRCHEITPFGLHFLSRNILFPFGLYFPSVYISHQSLCEGFKWTVITSSVIGYYSACMIIITVSVRLFTASILWLALVSIFSQPVKVWKTGSVNFSFTIFNKA